MKVIAVRDVDVREVARAMRHGLPWLPEATDYWLWHECFGETSFIARDNGAPIGGVLACVNQSRPQDLYIDQVAVDPAWRGHGVTKVLLEAVESAARSCGCTRVWLCTDPLNPAVRAWPPLGFTSLGLRRDFKGPGKDREVFEKRL
ncbi:MAG TPA: GNAT family N-acetyltransferase [Burkholderiales bacterium]|nr:GNAT family N-acetyltransferase [Burkholderiales bacterium]